jgi:hypothetical protein
MLLIALGYSHLTGFVYSSIDWSYHFHGTVTGCEDTAGAFDGHGCVSTRHYDQQRLACIKPVRSEKDRQSGANRVTVPLFFVQLFGIFQQDLNFVS